ncbi:MAG: hypothetical protein JO147_02140 [Actinobacteria bacterium]|nr:hypothetical protein [Actinomycetota bacterium]
MLFDIRPSVYTASSFESAVDVAASVVSTSGLDKSPVEMRLTDRTVLGGSRIRDTTPMIDLLTGVKPDPHGSLQEQLLLLRRAAGGTSLVVVTGILDSTDLPYVATLRRRFDRLVVVSISEELTVPLTFPGVRIITAADAESAAAAWNMQSRA